MSKMIDKKKIGTSQLYKRDLLCDDIEFVDNYIYYFSRNYGFLERMDINSGKSEIVYKPEEDIYVERLVSCDSTLYAVEPDLERLIIYDIHNVKYETLHIGMGKEPWGNIIDIFEYKGSIYIFSQYHDYYIEYDTKKKNVIRHRLDIDINIKKQGILINYEYWIFENSTGLFYVIDLRSKKIYREKCNHIISDLMDCDEFKGNIYLLTKCGTIYIFDIKKKSIIEVLSNDLDSIFSKIVVTNDKIILLPLTKRDDIWIYNRINCTFRRFTDYPIDYVYDSTNEWSVFLGNTILGTKLFFANRMENYYLTIDFENSEISWVPINKNSLLYEKRKILISQYVDNNLLTWEILNRDFELFLECLK